MRSLPAHLNSAFGHDTEDVHVDVTVRPYGYDSGVQVFIDLPDDRTMDLVLTRVEACLIAEALIKAAR